MSKGQKVVAGIVAVAVVASVAAAVFLSNRDVVLDVRMEEAVRRDLVATVTASGNIRARRSVDISSDVMGRVVELTVEEGDATEAGEVLLRLDPTQYRAASARAQAALSQAEAQAAQQRANVLRSERENERAQTLWHRDSTLVSRQQVEEAETNLQVARAQLTAAEHGVEQSRAALDEAEDQLSKTVIRAPISGTVTRLSIEEGETAVVGTMNNPGSLLLTVSDLSVVETLVEVDETDLPQIALRDSAVVEIDAFPDKRFTGTVTQIGSSAVRPPASAAGSGQAAAISFEVVVTLVDPPVVLRPDLSATAEIVTDVRENALSVPIIAVTVREGSTAGSGDDGGSGNGAGDPAAGAGDVEGVFRVEDGRARFTPITIGITGREHFEVLTGLSEGDVVVSGPYQQIQELQDGGAVQPIDEDGAAD